MGLLDDHQGMESSFVPDPREVAAKILLSLRKLPLLIDMLFP